MANNNHTINNPPTITYSKLNLNGSITNANIANNSSFNFVNSDSTGLYMGNNGRNMRMNGGIDFRSGSGPVITIRTHKVKEDSPDVCLVQLNVMTDIQGNWLSFYENSMESGPREKCEVRGEVLVYGPKDSFRAYLNFGNNDVYEHFLKVKPVLTRDGINEETIEMIKLLYVK